MTGEPVQFVAFSLPIEDVGLPVMTSITAVMAMIGFCPIADLLRLHIYLGKLV
jgi:hypothetical protein